jgi:GNAT superfamily N-acetyltransferase
LLERRPAAVADEAFLRELFATTRPDAAGWDVSEREKFLDLQFQAQRQQWRSDFPDSAHEVILLDGRPVGRAWVAWEPGECVFVDMTLLPAHRRGGVGSQVMESVIAEADRRGVPVRLTIERTNVPSLTFVDTFGFDVVAEDPVYVVLMRSISKDCPPRGSE